MVHRHDPFLRAGPDCAIVRYLSTVGTGSRISYARHQTKVLVPGLVGQREKMAAAEIRGIREGRDEETRQESQEDLEYMLSLLLFTKYQLNLGLKNSRISATKGLGQAS